AVQVWPIEPGRFMAWLTDRLRQRGLSASREAITELAARGEGNLLACAQEIERLGLLVESGTIELAHVLQSTSDNARFETFDLVDATLAGNARRGVRILRGLEREGVAPNVVIGTLAWQLRALSAMAGEISAGGSIDAAIRSQPAWSRRRKGLEATLRRSPPELWGRLIAQLARADAAAKGAYPSDPWVELETIVLDICGISAIPAEAV
nr:DNA polymerase III subunit delta [Gammaproteobacteria bacterium]